MGRQQVTLTTAAIRALRVGEELSEDRLYVERTDGGLKWSLRYTSPVTKRRREMGISATSLKHANERDDALRKEVDAGRDPLETKAANAEQQRREAEARQRQSARTAATLGAVAREVHRDLAPKFRNRKHSREWFHQLETNTGTLWTKPCADISIADALDVLLPLHREKWHIASRVRQRCEVVMDRAVLRGWADRNPFTAVKRELRSLAPRPATDGFRAIDYHQLPTMVAALRKSDRIGLAVRLAILFTIATAARSGETRNARWSEIDRKGKKWTVPAEKMKAKREHVVHLSAFALDVLREADELRDPKHADPFAFPAPRANGRALSDMALTMALRRIETGATRDDGEAQTFADVMTIHGARSCFSGWANEAARARPDIVERCLAHTEQNAVRGAYLRVSFERERAELLDRWCDFISRRPRTAKVVPLRSA